jgi:hypothetical protein
VAAKLLAASSSSSTGPAEALAKGLAAKVRAKASPSAAPTLAKKGQRLTAAASTSGCIAGWRLPGAR